SKAFLVSSAIWFSVGCSRSCCALGSRILLANAPFFTSFRQKRPAPKRCVTESIRYFHAARCYLQHTDSIRALAPAVVSLRAGFLCGGKHELADRRVSSSSNLRAAKRRQDL